MSKYDLSILIPARNEMFISNTVDDILKNKRGKTEILVGLDGAWAEPGIIDHPDVRVLYVSASIGQRAMTNKLAKLSSAKYVAKSDAHCTFDEGFDVKLMEAMEGHDDWTVVPIMRNLWAFDWKCYDCGLRTYQGPTPEKCKQCGKSGNIKRKLIWKGKESPKSRSYCFDSEPHFQYFGEFSKRPEGQGDITPTMSLQGSFFMLTRDKYWELDICDESFGSWGSQGIEVACKTWLSGGSVMCVQTTWYAHMFRTQGGDFSFPYTQHQSKVNAAKAKAKNTFFENAWEGQKLPLSWLVEKFWPVPGWTEQQLKELQEVTLKQPPISGSKGIIYYTTNELPVRFAHKVQDQIKLAGLPIVSSSLKPMDNMGQNIHVKAKRGALTMFRQILACLEASDSDIIFFCEHDVLYSPTHFDFTPTDRSKFYYNQNFWKVWDDGFAAHWDANQVSGLCGYRENLIAWYKHKIAITLESGSNGSYEPGGREASEYEVWNSPQPNIDVRGSWNLTRSHRRPEDFRDKSTCVNWKEATVDTVPGWDNLGAILK